MKKNNALIATENMVFPISMIFNGVEYVASNYRAVEEYAKRAHTNITMIDAYGVTKVIK